MQNFTQSGRAKKGILGKFRKKLGSVIQKSISQNSTKGRQGVEFLKKKVSAPPPPKSASG